MPLSPNLSLASRLSSSSLSSPCPTLGRHHPLNFKCHKFRSRPPASTVPGSNRRGTWDNPHPESRLGFSQCCRAAKQQSGPVKKRSVATKKKKQPKTGGDAPHPGLPLSDAETVDDGDGHGDDDFSLGSAVLMPKPPAGFVVDGQGRVLAASSKRTVTIVDPMNNLPLECVVRRVFRSSQGGECMLLCPIDTPVQILKSTNFEGWSAISDEEVQVVIPTAAYALAKIHLHLVASGFCYTVRGGFCYSEADIIEFHTDDGKDLDGLPTEGVEITSFNLDGAHYMIYTSCEPLLFVAARDQSGQLQIADDDLLDDRAVTSAIDEETEFNALVEEEAALVDSALGKR